MFQLRKHTLVSFEAEVAHQMSVEVKVERTRGDTLLKLTYLLELAESQNLHFVDPPWIAEPAAFKQDLWKHLCLEFFIKDPKSARYWEWNFSPYGHWGAFEFGSERNRLRPEPWINCGVRSIQKFSMKPSTFSLEVVLDLSGDSLLSWLLLTRENFQYSLNAIIEVEHRDSKLIEKSHWALKHALQKPDFHSPINFSTWTP